MNRREKKRGIEEINTIVRNYLEKIIQKGDLVVDATAGRGRDTLFLARCVGIEGRVIAFDIQEEALKVTRELLIKEKMIDRVRLLHKNHGEIASHVSKGVKAVIFNLGYLPGSDRKITTQADITVQAVAEALNLLLEKGIIAITVYRGHDGGLEESQALTSFLSGLPKKDFSVLQGMYLNQGELSPYWIMIQKNREDN
jgi:methylase of polypeptide subunit release factors